MKILLILPGLEEGGAERHVLWLSNELAERGHEVTVLSSGGKLEACLGKNVKTWHLPVHLKNPVTGIYSSLRILLRARKEGWQVIHSHSRVPSWIAWWASLLTGIPFVITAHSIYSLNAGLIPLKKAHGVICVSHSVKDHLTGYLPGKTRVIYNGLIDPASNWTGQSNDIARLLFIGRLTKLKGLHLLIESLSGIKDESWILDVAGDGPQIEELKEQVQKSGLSDRVIFHGFVDDTDKLLSRCSCFLFPSLSEGMGLTLMRAIQMGVPVIASDLPPVRELTERPDSLVSPGNAEEWRIALEEFLRNGKVSEGFKKDRILSVSEMAERIEREVYLPLLKE